MFSQPIFRPIVSIIILIFQSKQARVIDYLLFVCQFLQKIIKRGAFKSHETSSLLNTISRSELKSCLCFVEAFKYVVICIEALSNSRSCTFLILLSSGFLFELQYLIMTSEE